MSPALKCPVCKSSRIRRGYRPTPLWSKMIFRFNLLCDGCNLEFTGFALPWMIPKKTGKKSKVPKSGLSKSSEGKKDAVSRADVQINRN